MATLRYKDPSPYKQVQPIPPKEDYQYIRFQKDLELKTSSDTKQEPIHVALFGVGRAGSIHLSNLAKNPRVNLVYIVDDIQSKWEAIKKYWSLEGTKMLTSKDSRLVFNDPSVTAVVVASPTYTHEAIVKSALANGKAVFCEKPIAGDFEGLKRCYKSAEEAKLPLFCAFNRRFDASYANVRSQVRAGKVGHVHTIKVCSRDSPLPTIEYLSSSGGIFHDCAVHDIDMMCWILGEYPNKVFSAAHANVPEIAALPDYDTVAMVLSFPSGTIGTIDLSRNSNYGYDQRLEVFGPRGMVMCHDERPLPGIETYIGLDSVKKASMWYSFPSRYKQAYINEINHFLDVVQGLDKSSVHGKEMFAVSKIATALEESAKTGKYVDISWGPDELPPPAI